MITNFWKKITIFNAALLIIFLRIYEPLIDFINKNSEDNTIFAKSGESGYAFKESLEYDLDDINQITSSLIKKYKNNSPLLPIPQISINNCSFLNKIEICKDKKECFEEIDSIKEGNILYHSISEYNNSKIINNELIINLIKENNQFPFGKNNMKEIQFYNQIIDGYSSYLSLLSNDINLMKQVTQSENKMNNVLFLYVLYLKSYDKNNKIKNDIKINKLLEYHYHNIKNSISSLDHSKQEHLMLIIDKILKDNIFSCIPDLDMRYSFIVDFQSIHTMLQTILNIRRNNYDIKMLDFLFFKLTNAINNLFVLDKTINEKSQTFFLVQKYFFYIYWAISILIIYYCNKYFIRHKEFYKSKTRTIKNINANSEYKKYIRYQENIKKLQKKNRSNYTKEEIDMINKLTKDQKDYIISK